MTKIELFNSVGRVFHKAGFQLKKHAPEILVVTGVVGTVTSAVMACKATTKLSTILEETKETVDLIHDSVDNPNLAAEYTKEDSKKDIAIVYAQTGLKLAKLYGPAIAVGAASLGCILVSHNILHKRNLALAAAYATVDTGFKDYRNRVIERFGKDLDKELRYNIKAEEVNEVVKDEKTGEEKVVTKTVNVAHPNRPGMYAKCFDETCPNWTRNSEDNLFFLMQQQDWANEKLKRKGYLFLNEVYEMLGFQVTRAGQAVGWIYDEKNPIGDNYVDFGIHDLYDQQKRLFVNGYEKSIWVDFNVDGDIMNLLA